MNSKAKMEQCILECWKTISSNAKDYLSAMNKGMGPVKALVSHTTTLEQTKHAPIEDTDLYKFDPNIKEKLQFKIKKLLVDEKDALRVIIDELEKIHSSMEKQIDRVFGMFDSEKLNMSLEEMTTPGITSFCISEKIEALDTFKRNFYDNHNCRVFSIIYLDAGGDVNKFRDCWNTSKLESCLQDLQCIVTMN